MFTLPTLPGLNTGTDTIIDVELTTTGGIFTVRSDVEEKLTIALESNPVPWIVSRLIGAAEVLDRDVITGPEPDVTGAVAVSVSAGLVTPPADAVIWVVPADIPVARPALLIVATLGALLIQVKVSPEIVLPALSLAVAVNCSVPLTAVDAGKAGVTRIEATTGVGLDMGCVAAGAEEPPPEPQPTSKMQTDRAKAPARLKTPA